MGEIANNKCQEVICVLSEQEEDYAKEKHYNKAVKRPSVLEEQAYKLDFAA